MIPLGFVKGKIPDSVLIRVSTPGQLHITLVPWFHLLQRHGAVLKVGWQAADGGRWACDTVVTQGFRRWRAALQPRAEWAAT
jgi:hypothetical protein